MQEWTKIIGAAFQLSIALLVFSIGLRTTWSDVTYLFRRPLLLIRSIVARNVLVPAGTILLVLAMELEPPVAAALLALSIAAVPPILPQSLLKAGGREQYVLGLLASQSLLAVIFVPLTVLVFNRALSLHAHFAAADVVPIIGKLTLLPLAVGMAFRRGSTRWSDSAAPKINAVGGIMMAAALLGVIVIAWRAWLVLLGNGTLLAMILFVFIGLSAGQLLGGPRWEDRKSLTLACASSHPGLAMAMISTSAFPQTRLAFAAVFLYLIVQSLVTLPYKRRARPVALMTPLFRSGIDRRSRKRSDPDRRAAMHSLRRDG